MFNSLYLKSGLLLLTVPPAQVKLTREPREFRAGERGRIICESSSSNPPAQMSWFKDGAALEGANNSTKRGLHGGWISVIELELDLTEKMNGSTYTCEARNVQMQRASLDAITLIVLCKLKMFF